MSFFVTAITLIINQPSVSGSPNIVFILSDDQDWTDTSVQMHPEFPGSKSRFVETPNLEQLAARGMSFSAAYAPAPVCSPTRISLQTGKSPAQLHWTKASRSVTAADNYPLIPPVCSRKIQDSEITLVEMLKTRGYATAHYGKWHLSGGGPEQHGYDESDGDTGNKDAAPHHAPNPSDVFGITERANAFMEKNVKSNTPFFIQLSHHALHYPENSSAELLEKYASLSGDSAETKSVQRMAMAEHLDDGVGLIMQKIDELGITDHTYVIFMSDNGGGGKGGRKARPGKRKNVRPLTAGKGGVWEGGIRVPLIIRGPSVKAGTYCHSRVVGYDLYPTLCTLAGVEEPLPSGLEGGDISPLFVAGKGRVVRPREELVFHFPHYQGDTPHSAILSGNFKLMKWYEDGSVKLFNLSDDIGEQEDLSEIFPQKAVELKTRLEQYLTDISAQMPGINKDFDPSKPSVSRKGRKERKSREANR
ncbi:sulfatase [Verrucomicrobiota bacterium]